MSEVVDPHTAEKCFTTLSFRELMRMIVQDDLNCSQLHTLHFSLKLPGRELPSSGDPETP